MKRDFISLPRYTFTFWGALALFLGGVISIFFVFFLQLIDVEEGILLLLGNIAMWSGAILAFNYFICRRQTGKNLRFNFTIKRMSTVVISIFLLFGMVLIVNYLVALLPTEGKFWGDWYQSIRGMEQMMREKPILMFIMAVVCAPLFEEIVFRGIVLKGLLNGGASPMMAILASSFLFGLIHGNPWQFVGATMIGFVLGLVYYHTKTLLIPMLLHALNNAVAFVMQLYIEEEKMEAMTKEPNVLFLIIGVMIYSVSYFLLKNGKMGKSKKII